MIRSDRSVLVFALAMLTACGGDTTGLPDDPGSSGGPSGHIVYTSRAQTGYRALILLDVTSGTRQTVLSEPGIDEESPALSPDGTRIAFSSTRDGNPEIYTIGVDGSGITRITENAARDILPAWSPDGKKLIFNRIPDASAGGPFVIVNADGSGETTVPGTIGGDGVLSPDGSTLAYGFGQDVLLVNLDGSNSRTLAVDVPASEPAWSPDGSQIAFGCVTNENQEICIVNADGSNLRNITNSAAPIGEIQPSWSPDGKYVTYTTFRNGNDDIAQRKTDGTAEVVLTASSQAEEQAPSWSK